LQLLQHLIGDIALSSFIQLGDVVPVLFRGLTELGERWDMLR
jgi:hypothetical protein